MLLMMWTGIGLLLAASLYVVHHVSALPYAPECPTCRGVTGRSMRLSRLDRAVAAFGGADARHCPRCGWHGRMRWRLATARAREK